MASFAAPRILLAVAAVVASVLAATSRGQALQSGVPEDWAAKREHVVIRGEVVAGQRFTERFGPDFIFELRPAQDNWNVFVGWAVAIAQRGRTDNLARLTTHWSGPGALDILGWHFLSGALAPGEYRELSFSPEVGRAIPADVLSPGSGRSPEEIDRWLRRVGSFGQGGLSLWDVELRTSGEQSGPAISSVRFEAELSWPQSYQP